MLESWWCNQVKCIKMKRIKAVENVSQTEVKRVALLLRRCAWNFSPLRNQSMTEVTDMVQWKFWYFDRIFKAKRKVSSTSTKLIYFNSLSPFCYWPEKGSETSCMSFFFFFPFLNKVYPLIIERVKCPSRKKKKKNRKGPTSTMCSML